MTENQIEIKKTRARMLEDGAILCIRFENEAGDEAGIVDACRTAARGGMRTLEITLTTPGALKLIEVLSKDDDILVGAGTVLTPDDVRRVAYAGGKFVFSPVFHEGVVVEAHLLGLLAIPGAATATEIVTARRGGSPLVKVFPSGALGGPAYLRAVRGPLPDIPLIPTSGPTAETAADYFAAGAVAVGIGTAEVFPPGFDLAMVEASARRVREAVDDARRG